jgi:hypothetical protein
LLTLFVAAPRFAARCEEPDPAALVPQLSDAPALFTRLTGSDWSGETAARTERAEAGAPAAAVAGQASATSATAPLTSYAWQGGVRSPRSAGLYDLTQPPRRVFWWKWPFYGILGAPRDLVDGLFGAVGYVPPFNLALTGVGYEVLPMQFLMRPPSDWHRWPGGHANAAGHGWIDSQNGWGFFPNHHSIRFSEVDEKELARRRQHNADVVGQTARLNTEVNEHNAQVQTLRDDRMADASRAYQDGRYSEVVRLLRDYVGVDTSNREAKSMLATAYIALEADPAQPTTTRQRDALAGLLTHASKPTLALLKTELAVLAQRMPDRPEPLLYRVWANLQLANFAQVFEDATALVALEPANGLYHELRFEAALAGREPEWMTPALEGLVAAAGADSVAVRDARGRQALALGDIATARACYEALTAAAPTNPRYHYLRAMTEVVAQPQTGRFDRALTLRELEQARGLAHSPGDRVLYEKALRAAQLLTPPRTADTPHATSTKQPKSKK